MRSTQIRYLLLEGIGGLLRRRLSGSVAIMIMGAALLTLSIFSLVTINLDQLLQGREVLLELLLLLEFL